MFRIQTQIHTSKHGSGAIVLSDHATAEQLAAALAEVQQLLAEAQRLTVEAQRAGSQSEASSTPRGAQVLISLENVCLLVHAEVCCCGCVGVTRRMKQRSRADRLRGIRTLAVRHRSRCGEQTEWERRIQEYEGEGLETISGGMMVAVLASHATQSIWNVVPLAAGQANREKPSGAPEHVRVPSVRLDLRQRRARRRVRLQQQRRSDPDERGCSR